MVKGRVEGKERAQKGVKVNRQKVNVKRFQELKRNKYEEKYKSREYKRKKVKKNKKKEKSKLY